MLTCKHIIHVPFSNEEERLVKEELASNADLETKIRTIQSHLPGRTLQDCRRYVCGFLHNSIPDATFTEKKLVQYIAKPKLIST